MRLDDLLSLVRSSDESSWTVVSPPRLDYLGSWTNDEDRFYIRGHSSTAYYRDDIDIALAWGADHNEGKPWEGVWASWSHFPDVRVFGVYAEILWRGLPVHRELIASADGHRVYLPASNPVQPADGWQGTVTQWTVPRSSLALPRLINRLTGDADFDSALAAAGFEIAEG